MPKQNKSRISQPQPTPVGASSPAAVDTLPPEVYSLSPSSGHAGETVVIGGAHFMSATGVMFNGVAAPFYINSPASITATAPEGVSGTVHVRVTNSVGTSAETPADQFTYLSPVPVVDGVYPNSGSAGTRVVVTGNNFDSATGVTFGGVPAPFTIINNASLDATAPAHAPGTVHVRVANLAGQSVETPADQFTYASTVPEVSSVLPNRGTSGTSVVISGSNFVDVTGVTFGGTPATFTTLSPAMIQATAPPHPAGTCHVQVTNAAGTSTQHAADQFTYISTAPQVMGVTPQQGTEGTLVSVTGSNFTNVTSVTFGGVAATFQVHSPTNLSATAPPHAPGLVHVRVTTNGGTSPETPADQFEYVSFEGDGA